MIYSLESTSIEEQYSPNSTVHGPRIRPEIPLHHPLNEQTCNPVDCRESSNSQTPVNIYRINFNEIKINSQHIQFNSVSIFLHFWYFPVSSLNVLNTPPVLRVDRDWRILETEPIGSMITRVRADDEEDDPLVFGLDRKRFLEGGGEVIGPDKLPFRIDSDTGVVYLNESLAGRVSYGT